MVFSGDHFPYGELVPEILSWLRPVELVVDDVVQGPVESDLVFGGEVRAVGGADGDELVFHDQSSLSMMMSMILLGATKNEAK